MASEVSTFGRIISWVKQKLRDKEKNHKDFFLPYYNEVEEVLERHVQCAQWLHKEERSYFDLADGEVPANSSDELSERMRLLYPKAYISSGSRNLEQMSVEVTNLANKVDGTVDRSIVECLRDYATTCSQAHKSGDYASIELPCKNLLVLTRDLKAKIPTVHDRAGVQ
ncbi:hypothetical protein [Photobacterium lutimaris]|uniref:Uncharacterized protein n=1 Tax=Photobacterium lutimaris TaxID=388278 RepID=A0A2T3J4H7_9GAMM|nr:hypothetical protein [Photobacterium lutimaris]PSU36194.1 hypothetical protein C9I99_04125 [Photobacterium lutimaris]TDR74935.1 hypothetical protein DFP78_106266 [Photobacterium lutimaris]